MADKKIRSRRYDDTSSYARHYDQKVIGAYFDKPVTFRDFCAQLNKDTMFSLETHDIDPFCDDYCVLIERKIFNAQVEKWKRPILYGVIEKDGKGRFVEIDTEKYATATKILDMLVSLFKEENADTAVRLTPP